MSLNVSRCTQEDARELAEAFLATYGPLSRFLVTFHRVDRESLLEMFEDDIKTGMQLQDQPTATREVHYLKVTDPITNEIISYAIWNYLPQGYRVEDDGQVQVKKVLEGTNERLLRDFCRLTGEMRSEHPGRHEAHWLLSLLGTHPKHERRGAAALLVRWPFAQADRDGKRCYVDASPIGYNLYKRCGFEHDVGERVLDLDEYEPELHHGTVRWVVMMREPQSH